MEMESSRNDIKIAALCNIKSLQSIRNKGPRKTMIHASYVWLHGFRDFRNIKSALMISIILFRKVSLVTIEDGAGQGADEANWMNERGSFSNKGLLGRWLLQRKILYFSINIKQIWNEVAAIWLHFQWMPVRSGSQNEFNLLSNWWKGDKWKIEW